MKSPFLIGNVHVDTNIVRSSKPNVNAVGSEMYDIKPFFPSNTLSRDIIPLPASWAPPRAIPLVTGTPLGAGGLGLPAARPARWTLTPHPLPCVRISPVLPRPSLPTKQNVNEPNFLKMFILLA